MVESKKNIFLSSLFGGGMAGLVVDVSLFPLDTIKTRLQAPQGFRKAGSFSGVYRGIGPQIIGSVPQAALFFCTYESVKYFMEPMVAKEARPLVYMVGGALAEVVACVVRVPMEVVKQRRQTSSSTSSWRIARNAFNSEGIKGLYRGFGSTVIREVPFSIIQFPIWEFLKATYRTKLKNNVALESHEVANCGAVAGAISAAVTTPLDVVKTRIMLASGKSLAYAEVFIEIYKRGGLKGLFAGFTPRVLWITAGGYIFFGMYDLSKQLCNNYLLDS